MPRARSGRAAARAQCPSAQANSALDASAGTNTGVRYRPTKHCSLCWNRRRRSGRRRREAQHLGDAVERHRRHVTAAPRRRWALAAAGATVLPSGGVWRGGGDERQQARAEQACGPGLRNDRHEGRHGVDDRQVAVGKAAGAKVDLGAVRRQEALALAVEERRVERREDAGQRRPGGPARAAADVDRGAVERQAVGAPQKVRAGERRRRSVAERDEERQAGEAQPRGDGQPRASARHGPGNERAREKMCMSESSCTVKRKAARRPTVRAASTRTSSGVRSAHGRLVGSAKTHDPADVPARQIRACRRCAA